ncbi:MAG: polymer-forming cytoskeletal protein [Lachnospiraceae bacterium]|nr:polymer-forming cytoskeletal protein [Lachnospiraceae bacterium]
MVSDLMNPEMLEAETVAIDLEAEKKIETEKMEQLEDELESLEGLDEEDMLENTEDALAVDYSQASEVESSVNQEYLNVDLSKAVEAAILKNEEEAEAPASVDENLEDDSMAEGNNQLKDKEQDINSILTDDTTYITKGTTIKGNLETDGNVDVIGTIEGNLSCGGKLIVGGLIKGNVTAGEVYANAAKLEGDVICDGSVKIGVGTVVVGNVNATSAVIAGAVNGDIDVHGPVIVDSTAVIMGNIKSRSVQINNGAVIEGFCSQCYSEIDVKSFFE